MQDEGELTAKLERDELGQFVGKPGSTPRPRRRRPVYDPTMKRVMTHWPPATLERIDAYSSVFGVTRDALIVEVLNEWLDAVDAGNVEMPETDD